MRHDSLMLSIPHGTNIEPATHPLDDDLDFWGLVTVRCGEFALRMRNQAP